MTSLQALRQLDIVNIIADVDTDVRVLTALARISRYTRPVALQALRRVYDPRRFMDAFLTPACASHVCTLMRAGALITGPAVLHYLRRGNPTNGSIVILVPSTAVTALETLLVTEGYELSGTWGGSWDGTDGVDDSNPFRSESLVQISQFRKNIPSIWVGVPRVSMLHAILHLRSTANMNALSAAGFFSLYPEATLVDGVGAVTHIPTLGRSLFSARPLGTYHLRGVEHWNETKGPRPRSLQIGRRQFGDGATWLVHAPLNGSDELDFKSLGRNTWSLAARHFDHWGERVVESVIWTSIITSPLLDETYTGTALMKMVVLRVLGHIETVNPTARGLDAQMTEIVNAAQSRRNAEIAVKGGAGDLSIPTGV